MHVRRLFFLLSACALFGAPTTVLAEDPDGNVTEYRFADELVHGDLVNPNGEVLTVRRPGSRPSLVRARPHYIRELLKSVEML